MAVVTEQQILNFRTQGAVFLPGLLEKKWIDSIRHAIELDKQDPGPMARHNTPDGEPGEFFVDFQLWQRWPQCRDFVYNSPVAEVMGQLMGASRVGFYHDHLLVKEPATEAITPWHHDQPYYPVDGEMVASIWMPLDPIPQDICVKYVAGSHRWGKRYRPQYFNADGTKLTAGDDGFDDMPDIESMKDELEILSWTLTPGDVIAFYGLTVHGAAANLSQSRRRRAYATRWFGDDAVYASRPGRISPPIEGHGLKPGDKMISDMFPEVWRAA
jgi:ectoine hydroxylase-related dioxygenase (phytanoyl-CoA dioxygenase family)